MIIVVVLCCRGAENTVHTGDWQTELVMPLYDVRGSGFFTPLKVNFGAFCNEWYIATQYDTAVLTTATVLSPEDGTKVVDVNKHWRGFTS